MKKFLITLLILLWALTANATDLVNVTFSSSTGVMICTVTNSIMTLGFNLTQGGIMTVISSNENGNYSPILPYAGGAIQQSYYANPIAGDPGLITGISSWQWNPIQGGDAALTSGGVTGLGTVTNMSLDGNAITLSSGTITPSGNPYTFASTLTSQNLNGHTLYMKISPVLFDRYYGNPNCYFEQWITLTGSVANITYSMTYTGTTTRPCTTGFDYESPAVWLQLQFSQFFFYGGLYPGTMGPVNEEDVTNGYAIPTPTEPWGALLPGGACDYGGGNYDFSVSQAACAADPDNPTWDSTPDVGLGVYTTPYSSISNILGPWPAQEGSYMSVILNQGLSSLNSGTTVVYNSAFTIGSLQEIRTRFQALAGPYPSLSQRNATVKMQ